MKQIIGVSIETLKRMIRAIRKEEKLGLRITRSSMGFFTLTKTPEKKCWIIKERNECLRRIK